jgi:hypothetical protein
VEGVSVQRFELCSNDGQFSGSKNMPLFPDLFLRDSHFGNSVLKTGRKIGKVTGINLVDENSEFMVISQFGKIIRIDTKSIRAARPQHPGRQAPRPRTPGQSSRRRSHSPEEAKTQI